MLSLLDPTPTLLLEVALRRETPFGASSFMLVPVLVVAAPSPPREPEPELELEPADATLIGAEKAPKMNSSVAPPG
jgi:hypothetical protein